MQALQSYVTEIQSANATLTGRAHQTFCFNGVADHAAYHTKLHDLEFAIYHEYAQKTKDTKGIFWQKVYAQYLTNAKDFFFFEDKGEVHHCYFRLSHPFPNAQKETLLADAYARAQAFIRLQFDSITRLHTLLVHEQAVETSPYYWPGKQIQLLEIGHAFLLCGYILPVNLQGNKQKWFNALFRFFRQPPPAHLDQSIYKMINREQPARFLFELHEKYRKIIQSYA